MTVEKIWESINDGVFVIAEVGKGFIQTEDDRTVSEYLQNAKDLAKAALESGATTVKFQTHTVEDEQLQIDVVSHHFKGADRYSWVKRNNEATPLETFWRPLKEYCDEIGILFHSTPMSRGAARILSELDVSLWKVGSGDVLDFVMLDYIASTGKPVIISSGMSTIEELDKAVAFLKHREVCFALLHCVSQYPCPPEDLNLATISFLKKRYGVPVGFSDHSLEINTALEACALGATVIEKHFSFSRDLWGSDHKVALTPSEFSEMTRKIKAAKADNFVEVVLDPRVMGNEEKFLQESETGFRPLFRKSLMASKDIKPGTILSQEDVYAMRPQAYAGGMPSEEYERLLGKKTKVALKKYDPFTLDGIE